MGAAYDYRRAVGGDLIRQLANRLDGTSTLLIAGGL
jgi:hypothetical protein